MFGQVVERLRLAVLGKIAGRANDLELRGSEASRDQTGIVQHAEPHGDVDALFDQIDVTVREGEAQSDVRIFSLKRAEQRHHFQPAERHRHIDAQIAGYFLPGLLEHQLGLFDVGQGMPAALEKRRAVLGQGDAAGGAGEEPRAGLFFQPLDRVADPGLGDAEISGGAHEALALGHFDEDRERAQVGHPPIYHH